jgi:phosphatidylcholine synthase
MPPRKKNQTDSPQTPLSRRIAGLCVHGLTAAGAAAGLMALVAAFEQQFSVMFFWLGAALLIDGIDGTFARLAEVQETAPEYEGAVLDLIVDYLTYVIVPVVAIWRSGFLDGELSLGLGLLIIVCSSFYFADRRMKMDDQFFRGFPALWNVVALYFFVFHWPEWLNAGLIIVLCILMFVPVPFVHPVRVKFLRPLTLAVTLLWLICATLAVTQGLKADMLVKVGLGVCAVYFVALSVWRFRHQPARGEPHR